MYIGNYSIKEQKFTIIIQSESRQERQKIYSRRITVIYYSEERYGSCRFGGCYSIELYVILLRHNISIN